MSTKAIILLFSVCAVFSAHSKPNSIKSKKIHTLLVELNEKEKVPGLIAAIIDQNGLSAISSTGIRKVGSDKQLTVNDLIHLGSCTKAMTCTMLATLVAEGKISWETTLIKVMPELKTVIHSDFHHLTLWQLVTHRAGLPANAKNWWVHQKIELKERRLLILKENLKDASGFKAGDFLYSNLGYMVASCMAEKIAGATWESLIKKRLFNPLGMVTASFGPPGIKNKIDQPWGHLKSEGKWNPKYSDNAEALGPAGRVHCSFEDWAKFISLQFPHKMNKILARKQLDKLIVPTKGGYAGGWGVSQRNWAKGITLSHSGSNTKWYSIVWVAPKLNRAYIAATNSKTENSAKLCDMIISKLIEID
jgi:CubicO group peptidase (beta-lactamase class C family)